MKFSKRRSAVPLVAAKLDQSRVLVTKFSENRLTLKGRSAGQRQTDRHTDRQTNSAENKGPSGLQSGQQTPLKASTSLRYATAEGKNAEKIKFNMSVCADVFSGGSIDEWYVADISRSLTTGTGEEDGVVDVLLGASLKTCRVQLVQFTQNHVAILFIRFAWHSPVVWFGGEERVLILRLRVIYILKTNSKFNLTTT